MRICLTVGFQINHDSVILECDFLNWNLTYAMGKNFSNICIGPFGFSFCRDGGVEEQLEIMESEP